MESRGRNTKQTWINDCRTYTVEYTGERIERNLPREPTSPKRMDGQRPLGMAALEDKIVQYAVVTVLNQIYEEDFLGFSYGFRTGEASIKRWMRSGRTHTEESETGCLMPTFVTSSDQFRTNGWAIHRAPNRRPKNTPLNSKVAEAGVSEDGVWAKTEVGTPQGAVASPLLANVYLHYAFDLWAQHWREHRAAGDVIVVRYADDIVMGFEQRADAERFLQEWKERLRKFGWNCTRIKHA